MNSPINYLITGAAIAAVCGVAGAVGGWTAATIKNEEFKIHNAKPATVSGQVPVSTIQLPATSGQSSVFSGQRMPQSPVITIPLRPANGSNFSLRPTLPNGKTPLSYSQFQQLQEVPEVKAARDAFMEAQKKYSEAVKKAMRSGQGVEPRRVR